MTNKGNCTLSVLLDRRAPEKGAAFQVVLSKIQRCFSKQPFADNSKRLRIRLPVMFSVILLFLFLST